MKRGLIIGKFLPLHTGHVALVEFAVAQCDELIISMSYKPSDPIDPNLRFSWIVDTFRNMRNVRPEMVADDFDDESLPIAERTAIWASFIRRRYPPVDIVFTSEEYGEPFARQLEVPHIAFDIQRQQVPVSASMIRQRPMTNWDFIPTAVRPYFVKKICFYGPESTGKTVLIRKLATAYQTDFVPEVAKEIITSNSFTDDDSISIGQAQNDRVREKVKTANRILLCDTDVITTQIYSLRYNGHVPPQLYELEKEIQYDLYLLFDIDVPWVADGMRDLNNERPKMYAMFKEELVKRKIPFVVVRGSFEEREKVVTDAIAGVLKDTVVI